MHSLFSLVLELQPVLKSAVPFKPWYGTASRALLLHALQKYYSSQVSQLLHSTQKPPAYTCSNLIPISPLPEIVSPNSRFLLRFTALNRVTTQALIELIKPNCPLYPGRILSPLAGLKLRVTKNFIKSRQHPLGDLTCYESLLDEVQLFADTLPDQISLVFTSPTFFKLTKTRAKSAEITPRLVFNSLFERWKTYTKDDLSASVRELHKLWVLDHYEEYIQAHVTIKTAEVKYLEVNGKKGTLGYVVFQSEFTNTPYWLFTHILARYAKFAGVGAETATGFGQCRRVEENMT